MTEVTMVRKVTSHRVEAKPETAAENKNLHEMPIGMFDSGVGGITVLSEVIKQLPHEDIIYVGDTLHVPYGSKTPDELIRFNQEIFQYFASRGVKMVIVACNSSSAVALPHLHHHFPFSIVGMITPGARAAARTTVNNHVGVIATEATVKSGAYAMALHGERTELNVFTKACPLFVPLVEGGFLQAEETIIIAREYLKPLIAEKIDTLVLGCTHYPHLAKVLQEILGSKVKLVDPAKEAVVEAKSILGKKGLLKDTPMPPTYEFWVTSFPMHFQELGAKLLGHPIPNVKLLELEKQ